jgi:hypothetical protein
MRKSFGTAPPRRALDNVLMREAHGEISCAAMVAILVESYSAGMFGSCALPDFLMGVEEFKRLVSGTERPLESDDVPNEDEIAPDCGDDAVGDEDMPSGEENIPGDFGCGSLAPTPSATADECEIKRREFLDQLVAADDEGELMAFGYVIEFVDGRIQVGIAGSADPEEILPHIDRMTEGLTSGRSILGVQVRH